ncbi:MAG: nucleotide exchange factor GrpE [Acidimicrobiia bacterium]
MAEDTPEVPAADTQTGEAAAGPADSAADDPIARLEAERDEMRALAQRVQADFDNYRKRAAGQLADEIDRVSGRIVEALLPVLDACEAATSHGVDGVQPVWTSLRSTLEKHGLEALSPAGEAFDPSVAEAVMHESADGAPDGADAAGATAGPVVVEVLRTGYRWKGRVLRPAMVKVRG